MVLAKRGLAVALSGGSARGLAHIGFLEVMEENHIAIDTIVGTSMGALVGGLYAAGTLNDFKKNILKLSESKIATLFLSRTMKNKKGNTNVQAIKPFLEDFTTKKKIEKLPIDFTAISTDLKTGEEVYIKKGDLLHGILASISIPGVFKPVRMQGRVLVDGGVVDPLPGRYAHTQARKVIAVNAMPTKLKYNKKDDVFSVLSETVAIMTNELINLRQETKSNHLFVQLKTSKIDSADFSRVKETIEIGRIAARKNLRKIIRFANK